MLCRKLATAILVAGATTMSAATVASAETEQIRIAYVPGSCNLAHCVMDERKLVEKHMAAAGLPEAKVTYQLFAGAGQLGDALLSGSLDFGALGATQAFVLADRTASLANPFKIAVPLCDQTFVLMSANPDIKTPDDLKPGSRIAMPTPKNSVYAQVLQIYAAKKFGWDKRGYYDDMGIPMGHPEAVASLKAKDPTVTAHFTGAPWSMIEAKSGARQVLSSFDVTGPASLVAQTVSKRWKDSNPKSYAAVVAAFKEATELLAADPKFAAELIIRREKPAGVSEAELIAYFKDKSQIVYANVPHGTQVWRDFMFKSGILKNEPRSWQDVYWENNMSEGAN
jgi:NitT/TauT family transport system substrate-binding protein